MSFSGFIKKIQDFFKNIQGTFKKKDYPHDYGIEKYLGGIFTEEVMKERGEMYPVDINDSLGHIINSFEKSHSYLLPVYQHNTDNIIGAIDAKRLLNLIISRPVDKSMSLFSCLSHGTKNHALKKVLFVSQYMDIFSLVSKMYSSKSYLVTVLDDKGCSVGFITSDDIFKYIIDDILKFEKFPSPDRHGFYSVHGSMSIDSFKSIISWLFQNNPEVQILNTIAEHEEDNDTISGMICTILGRVPEINERIKIEEIILVIEEASLRKIKRLKFKPETGTIIKKDDS